MTPVFTIFLGDKKTIFLKLVQDECCGGGPVDLTHCTALDLALPKQDGTLLHLLLSDEEVVITSPAVLGKFSAPISEEDSALLNVGEYQNVLATFTIAGEVSTVRFDRALSVFEVR